MPPPSPAPGLLRVRGARTHNLRDLSLDLPLAAWTAVTGVSGSGKSSLVLDTIGAESRRRFLGALARTRQGLELVARPDVDRIEGLPPAVLLGAGERAPGPLETVGTLTEASHALRALFARAATPHCPACGAALSAQPRPRLVAALAALPEGTRLTVLVRQGRGRGALEAAERAGFVRVRVGGGAPTRLNDVQREQVPDDAPVDVVLDRLGVRPGLDERLRDTVDAALAAGAGLFRVQVERPGAAPEEATLATRPACGACEQAYPPLTAQRLSHTHPDGACPACRGRGSTPAPAAPGDGTPRGRGRATRRAGRGAGRGGVQEPLAPPAPCRPCGASRLAPYGAAARLAGRTLPEAERAPAAALAAWLAEPGLRAALPAEGGPALDDLRARLDFLGQLGLSYLPLGRAAEHLARGELRRVRLAAACAARISGLLYVLDEPLAGCAPAEREAVRRRLRALVEEGSTVLSVEHDLRSVRAADHVVELGPGAGRDGGALVAQGSPAQVAAGTSALARALARPPPTPRAAPRSPGAWVSFEGLSFRTLQGVGAAFPAVGLTCVVGVSGAGKHTLVFDLLARLAAGAPLPAGARGRLAGASAFAAVSASDARAVRHPRAMPLSLLRAFEPLREVLAQTLEARTRGWGARRFSLGVPGGRCEPCRGTGESPNVLRDAPELHVPCEACAGRRYAPDTEAVRVKGLSIADVLALTVEEGAATFRDLRGVGPALRSAAEVGLSYLPLGRPASRLSLGEVLRLRLAAALARGGTAPTLYLLDEPASGLHPDDVSHLLTVLERLVAAGHGIVAVEHDAQLIAAADHVLALGPGPGEAGGRLLYAGPPAGLPGGPAGELSVAGAR